MIKAIVDFGNNGFNIECSVFKDGNKWCCLVGDNIQEGVAGFGFTPAEAISEFKVSFRNEN
ncbi:hypothetical protein NVP1076O_35 [Vibrio phage 1.076.O._10N.286.51.B7]|nr:hypothetical protein NVP1076O_35 [Vibrio phage 1.076.O._10N.286.51.B7]